MRKLVLLAVMPLMLMAWAGCSDATYDPDTQTVKGFGVMGTVHCDKCDKDMKAGSYCKACNRFMLAGEVECAKCEKSVPMGTWCAKCQKYVGVKGVTYDAEKGMPVAKADCCSDTGTCCKGEVKSCTEPGKCCK